LILGYSIIEAVSRSSLLITKVKSVHLVTRTKYQEVQIVELEDFGRALVLDGYIQSSEADEFIYHETLVHPAMVAHPGPERVLIIGGGEGATLREVLKHSTVDRAVMVDIDGELVELAKKYLDFMHQGSFNSPRAEVVISDGKDFVRRSKDGSYDVVVLDLTDPYCSELARSLYSREFYRDVRRVLKEDGLMVTQAGNSFFYPDTYRTVLNNVRNAFPIVREYWSWIPSFSYACNFIVGSLKHDPASMTSEEVDRVLRGRGVKTGIYDGRYHTALFSFKVFVGEYSKG